MSRAGRRGTGRGGVVVQMSYLSSSGGRVRRRVRVRGRHERHQQRGRAGAAQEGVVQQALRGVALRRVAHERALHEGEQVGGAARRAARARGRHVADAPHRLGNTQPIHVRFHNTIKDDLL